MCGHVIIEHIVAVEGVAAIAGRRLVEASKNIRRAATALGGRDRRGARRRYWRSCGILAVRLPDGCVCKVALHLHDVDPKEQLFLVELLLGEF